MCLFEEAILWGYLVYDAHFECGGGVYPAGCQYQFFGLARAYEAGEALGFAYAGDYAEADFGEGELGVVGGDAEIQAREISNPRRARGR